MANDDTGTGNVFWIYFTFLSVISLVYLAFWSFHNENLKGLAISIIFSLLIIFTHIFSKGEVFTLKGNFSNNAFWFMLGFIIWGTVVIWKKMQLASMSLVQDSFQYSLLSSITPQQNQLLATISAELPQFWQFFTNQITVPFIEESFWLIGIPFGIIWLLNSLAEERESFSWLASPATKFVVALIVAGITFPLFHVQGAMLIFILSAFIFRAVIITFYWGDELLDVFPWMRVIASFAVGMHIANNWVDFGFFKGLALLAQSAFGWVLIVSFVAIILAGIDHVIETPLRAVFQED